MTRSNLLKKGIDVKKNYVPRAMLELGISNNNKT